MLKTFMRNLFVDIKFMKSKKSRNSKENAKRFKKSKNPDFKMQRQWESISPTATKAGGEQATTFKLLSYNILAQDLLVEHLTLYKNIDPQYLRWENRLRRLREEVAYLKPDIMCLQEMQFNHIKEFVKNVCDCRKLEYVFKKKTGHRTDGCAIIYDRSKFKLIAELGVEYYTSERPTLNRENIALLAKFCLRDEPSKQIVIATTHLLYNPKRDDVRVAQVDKLLSALNEFACSTPKSNDQNLPIILTGDFNSQPFTAPYMKLISSVTGKLSTVTSPALANAINAPIIDLTDEIIDLTEEDSCDLTKESSNSAAPMETSSKPVVDTETNLQLTVLDFGTEGCSTFQNQWIVVDYILKSISSPDRRDVKICSIYKLPLIRDCYSIGKIPNNFIGSDHYSLAISFSFV